MQPSESSAHREGFQNHPVGGFKELELELLLELSGTTSTEHKLSKYLPAVFADPDPTKASKIIEAFANSKQSIGQFFYEPELMTLLSHKAASAELIRSWTKELFGADLPKDMHAEVLGDVGYSLGKCGELALSFPLWRFPAQRVKEGQSSHPALLEQASMQRIVRDSDTYIDPSDGVRKDWLGVAFVSKGKTESEPAALIRRFVSEDTYIEFRRSYLLVSNPLGTLVIRNSSYFFGRDRLQHSAYFSPRNLGEGELLALTDKEIDAHSDFLPITSEKLYRGTVGLSAAQVGKRMSALVDELLAFEEGLSSWMLDTGGGRSKANPSPGFPVLVDELEIRWRVANATSANKDEAQRKMPVLGFINHSTMPWFPHAALKLDTETIAALRCFANGEELLPASDASSAVLKFLEVGFAKGAKLALMSGEKGDYLK